MRTRRRSKDGNIYAFMDWKEYARLNEQTRRRVKALWVMKGKVRVVYLG